MSRSFTSQTLRYGNNPHQAFATYGGPHGALEILNGAPSYINILDILIGWQLTKDLSTLTGSVAAVSMKHCTPVGLASAGPTDAFTRALLAIEENPGTATSSYLRARSSDWSAAYGDVAVIFGEVDEKLAGVLARLVVAGVAATSYTERAIEVLKRKRGGQCLVAKLDPDHVPPNRETREVFGFRLTQERNILLPTRGDFTCVVGDPRVIDRSCSDLCLVAVAMKYCVSNNIVIAAGGRTLSISAGQQSRIHATKLACRKFAHFMRLQDHKILKLTRSFRGTLTEKIAFANQAAEALADVNLELNEQIVLGSDGFIPFIDNVVEASRYNVQIILEPAGALRSPEIELAIESNGMDLIRTPYRFFYH